MIHLTGLYQRPAMCQALMLQSSKATQGLVGKTDKGIGSISIVWDAVIEWVQGTLGIQRRGI